MINDVIVIGGGPAGIMAAICAAQNGKNVLLLEKNEKLGKKLFITGKGRCNITNDCDIEDFFSNVIRNPKFLMSSFYTFSNDALIKMLNDNGLKTKVERGGRVFPDSDRSSDVITCLKRIMDKNKIRCILNTKVTKAVKTDKVYIAYSQNKRFESKNLIIATGGCSYPLTGSDGDGYIFAREFGHKITDIHPALIPLAEDGRICSSMQGLTLKNVVFSLYEKNKVVFSDMGEMLFTHFGLSGPLVLSASSFLSYKTEDIYCLIDLKPALDLEKLDARILRDFEQNKNKKIINVMSGLLPSSMIEPFLNYCNIDPGKSVNSVTKQERFRIRDSLKGFKIKIKGTRPIDEAIITRGGIDIKQINPSTMESKSIPGLYFAGEVLNVDALTGGFNLQIAFSTGYLAGMSVS